MGLLDAFADPQFRKDVVRGLLDAGNRGAVAGLLGGPVDLATMALRPLGYNVEQPVGGSEWIGQKMQNLGLVSEKRNPLAEGLAAFAGPMVAQQIAPKVFAAELRAMENMAKPSPMNAATRGQAGAIVWHGSPHKFDKFDSSKIGTGEGAQAYGHGLYLAQSDDVARSYAGMNPVSSVKVSRLPDGKFEVLGVRDSGPLMELGEYSSREAAEQAAQAARDAGSNLYKVDLPDDQIARMLDWDKPLSQQAPEVQNALDAVMQKRAASAEAARLAMNEQYPGRLTHPVLSKIANKPRTAFDYKGEAAVSALVQELGGPAKASEYLRAQGIPGIRYLDGGSRGAGAGTSNYVVFPGNEDLLRILERNGVPLP